FTLGSSTVAIYHLSNVPAVSKAPTGGNFKTVSEQILAPPANVVTINGAAVPLPTSPATYFLGVRIHPDNKVTQLNQPKNALQVIHRVGPPQARLSASGIISAPNSGQFPVAPGGNTVGIS